MNQLGKLRQQREKLLGLAKEHGAVRLRVFGSVARGDDRPDSDIDFLVRLDPSRSLLDLVGLYQSLVEFFSGRRVDVISEDGISPHMKEGILKEAVDL